MNESTSWPGLSHISGVMICKDKPSNFTVSHMHNLHAVMLAGSPKSVRQLVAHGSQGTQATQRYV